MIPLILFSDRVALGVESFTQQAGGVVLRVHVTDETGPVEGALLRIISPSRRVLATASTDANGNAVMSISESAPFTYTVRKLGYAPVDSTVETANRGTITLDIHLTRIQVRTLDTVRTTERTRILSNNYVLGAAEIANSHRYIVDAYDALHDLRPTMLGDRLRDCPYARNLWVNGRRQLLGPWEPLVPLEGMGVSPRDDGSGRPPLRALHLPSHAPPGTPLSMIKAEHIAEIRYVSCWQRSQVGLGGDDAVFVTLKPGVGFDLRNGSHIVDSAAARRARVIP